MNRLAIYIFAILLGSITIALGCSPKEKNISFSLVNNDTSKIYVHYFDFATHDTDTVEIVTDDLATLLTVKNSNGGSNWFYDYKMHITHIYNLAGDSVNFNPNESQYWFLYVSDPDYFYRLYIKDTDF